MVMKQEQETLRQRNDHLREKDMYAKHGQHAYWYVIVTNTIRLTEVISFGKKTLFYFKYFYLADVRLTRQTG